MAHRAALAALALLALLAGCTAPAQVAKPTQTITPKQAPTVAPVLDVAEGGAATVSVSVASAQATHTSQETTQDASKAGGATLDVGKAGNVSQSSTRGDTTIHEGALGAGWLELLLSMKTALLAVGILAGAGFLSMIAGVLVWQAHSRPSGSKAESAFWGCVGMGLVAVPVILGLLGGLAALRAAIT